MSSNIIELFCVSGENAEVNRREAFRYSGITGDYKNEEFEEVYDECLSLFRKNADMKAVFRKSSLSFGEGDMIKLDFCSFESKALKKNLEGCRYVWVFAATTGLSVDRLLLRYRNTSLLKALTVDAIASSAIECFCDKLNSHIVKDEDSKPRFSLGYGDTDLIYQKDLLSFLEADKRLGISLNSSMMMTPVKSVTAFIGIK